MKQFKAKAKAAYRQSTDLHEAYSYKERWFRDYREGLPKIREELGKGYLLRTTLALTESQAKRLSQNIEGETKFIPISEWRGEKVGFLLYKPKPVPKETKAPQTLDLKALKELMGEYEDVGGKVLASINRNFVFIPKDADDSKVKSILVANIVGIAKRGLEEAEKSLTLTPLAKLTPEKMQNLADGKYHYILTKNFAHFDIDKIWRAKQILGEPSSLLFLAEGWAAVKGKHGTILISKEKPTKNSNYLYEDDFKEEMKR